MNFVSVLSCLSLLLAAAVAQYPKPCVVPPLLTGSFSMSAGNGFISASGSVTYSALGQQMRLRSIGVTAGQTFIVDQVMLFNEKVYYEIDWSKESCKKFPLNTEFIPMQVPANAKLMGQSFLGSSSSWGMGVLTNTWYGKLSENGHYTTAFTEVGCIPIFFSGYTPETGWITYDTFNWIIGTSNPMDFIPPDFCVASKLEETKTPHSFFTAVESLAMKTKRDK
ncbi:ependymin [Oreochromis niloticus]|uniref:Ependymin n=2 Tax=Oreochromis TaxID=8139 RepID=I3KHA8_ORENI|nr:ependymin [Oreochromis niloticus]CAI5679693.1 unnamed protein product [Mustela putorius furo]